MVSLDDRISMVPHNTSRIVVGAVFPRGSRDQAGLTLMNNIPSGLRAHGPEGVCEAKSERQRSSAKSLFVCLSVTSELSARRVVSSYARRVESSTWRS